MNSARVVSVGQDRIISASGAILYRESLSTGEKKVFHTLPIPWWRRFVMRLPIVCRLLRLGIHYVVSNGGRIVIIANKETYLLEEGRLEELGPLNGSRPLALCASGGCFFYGEYRSNVERTPVHIYGLPAGKKKWEPVWTFSNVRHVHGVFHDPYTGWFWVTTGDDDNESAIWCTRDRFKTLQRVAFGNQQVRTVHLLFTNDSVYFGSDTPQEKNYIYRMDRSGENIEPLVAVNGSVFYGCKVGEKMVFSTAVEPSKVNTHPYAELWHSDDGQIWDRLISLRKDRLPMKYFQHGQIMFPDGVEHGSTLYFTPFAVEGHGRTLSYPFDY